MRGDIDLDYRPGTYFRPQTLERYLLSKVKGEVLRKNLQALLDDGEHAEVRSLLTAEGMSAADQKALGSLHPMFMGGNYLPDTKDGEVEIARISIESTTFDVTCVYARPVDAAIHYRVVDEYGGDTLTGKTEARTVMPMKLGELMDFFLEAWPLLQVIEMNFDDDPEGRLDFFTATSEFYPDFGKLCLNRVIEHFREKEDGTEAGG